MVIYEFITNLRADDTDLINGKVYKGGLYDDRLIKVKFPKGTPKIVHFSHGLFHCMAIDYKGGIWGWALTNYEDDMANCKGQLGLGKGIKAPRIPTKLQNINKMKKVYCGMNHTLCLDRYNKLWGFGENKVFQTGFGDSKSKQYKPIIVREGVSDIYAGKNSNTTFIINMNNEVEVIGRNAYGQAGIDSRDRIVGKSFVSVKSLNGKGKIQKIVSNARAAFCLFENGELYSTGRLGYNGRDTSSKEFFKIDKKYNIIDLACVKESATIFLTKYGEVLICQFILDSTDYNDIGLSVWGNLDVIIPENIKEKPHNFNIHGDFIKCFETKTMILWCTPRVIKKKKEMKECSHCKKKILVGKEFFYKRRPITTCHYDKKFNVLTFFLDEKEKFIFHFECLRDLPEDFQEEIKDKMKRDLL